MNNHYMHLGGRCGVEWSGVEWSGEECCHVERSDTMCFAGSVNQIYPKQVFLRPVLEVVRYQLCLSCCRSITGLAFTKSPFPVPDGTTVMVGLPYLPLAVFSKSCEGDSAGVKKGKEGGTACMCNQRGVQRPGHCHETDGRYKRPRAVLTWQLLPALAE